MALIDNIHIFYLQEEENITAAIDGIVEQWVVLSDKTKEHRVSFFVDDIFNFINKYREFLSIHNSEISDVEGKLKFFLELKKICDDLIANNQSKDSIKHKLISDRAFECWIALGGSSRAVEL